MAWISTDSNEFVQEHVGDLIFQFRAGEFFQNNPFILSDLVDYVIQQSQPQESSFLIDAYCGAAFLEFPQHRILKKLLE